MKIKIEIVDSTLPPEQYEVSDELHGFICRFAKVCEIAEPNSWDYETIEDRLSILELDFNEDSK